MTEAKTTPPRHDNWVARFLGQEADLSDEEQKTLDRFHDRARRQIGEHWKSQVAGAGKAVAVDNGHTKELPPHRPRG